MAEADAELLTCEQCGSTVYPEHIEDNKAQRVQGKLLCMHCVQDFKAAGAAAASTAPAAPDPDEEPLTLMDDVDSDELGGSQIRQFGTGSGMEGSFTDANFKRPLLKDSRSATRCRTFHAKLTDASLVHMNDTINEWVDQNPDIEIKFAVSNIGVVEGKHQDPHLITTVFY